jgi:thiamine pyrophosphokinase
MTMTRRALIVAGGALGPETLRRIRPDDFRIGVDRGALFLVLAGHPPHLALGDFDSVTAEEMAAIRAAAAELYACDPVDKDWTDTELAFREAVRRGFRQIAIVGALGSRFDHSLANVHLLRQAHEAGCELTIADDQNEIRLCAGRCRLEADEHYRYVSLLPLTPEVRGVTLEGFRYPLRDATLTLGWSPGVSNELAADAGTIEVADGLLLVIRSRD